MFFQMLSTFVQSVGAMVQGNSQAKAASYDAKIASYNSNVTTQEGQVAEQQVRLQTAGAIGQQRANIGASGFAGDGSAADVISESAYNAEMDALNTRFNYKTKAQSYSMQSGLDEQRAKSSRIGGNLSASSILLAGSGKGYQQYSSDTAGNTPFRF